MISTPAIDDPLSHLAARAPPATSRSSRAATCPSPSARRTDGWSRRAAAPTRPAPRRSHVVVHRVDACAVSATCQTTIAAISTGLPSASLTFRRLVSKLRTRTLTLRRRSAAAIHDRPGSADGADVGAEELHDPGLAGLHDHQRGSPRARRRRSAQRAGPSPRGEAGGDAAGEDEYAGPAGDRQGRPLRGSRHGSGWLLVPPLAAVGAPRVYS